MSDQQEQLLPILTTPTTTTNYNRPTMPVISFEEEEEEGSDIITVQPTTTFQFPSPQPVQETTHYFHRTTHISPIAAKENKKNHIAAIRQLKFSEDVALSTTQFSSHHAWRSHPSNHQQLSPVSVRPVVLHEQIKQSPQTMMTNLLTAKVAEENADRDEDSLSLFATASSSSAPVSVSSAHCRDSGDDHEDRDQTMIASDWALPRWEALERKRLALCRQRVQLERQLFETILVSAESTGDTHFQDSTDKYHAGSQCLAPSSLPDRDTVSWTGPVNAKGLPDGRGILVSHEQIFDGFCRNGVRHGRGRNVWTKNGQVYTGEWVADSRCGRGTHTWPDGRTVTGHWNDGHLHGRVFFTWPDGATYDGDTAYGQKQGKGTHTWADGRVYSGQYVCGYEHGTGSLTEAKQASKYRGQFQMGNRHGRGIQFWPTKTYEGEWMDNEIHGTGRLLWHSTGASYEGEFHRGHYHGYGCYKSGGKTYMGQWKGGDKEGVGKYLWHGGRVYEGSFLRNKRSGFGKMMYLNGTLYAGQWKAGKKCGLGIEMNLAGTMVHCGTWEDNQPTFNYVTSTDEKKRVLDDCSITEQTVFSATSSQTSRSCRDDSKLFL
jgi:hypothetical protein